MTSWTIKPWPSASKEEAERFLNANCASASYLIANLNAHGPTLTGHINSGNYWVIESESGVSGVFCLTRRGILLVETDGQLLSEEKEERILDCVVSEPLSFRGIMGSQDAVTKLWSRMVYWGICQEAEQNLSEVAFCHNHIHDYKDYQTSADCQYLTDKDFTSWLQLRTAYLKELGLGDSAHGQSLENDFQEKVSEKSCWGFFDAGELIAITHLNGTAKDLGIIGGVYTVPEHRGKGVAKRMVAAQVGDCYRDHHLRTLTLHADKTNEAALSLYASLGFEAQAEYGSIMAKARGTTPD